MKNRFRLNLFRFVLLLSVCVSCSQEYDKALEDALNLAGENRPELEKVLRHYHGDTLKLEAAKFLIRNMPGHYSFADTMEVKPYYDEVDSVLTTMKGCNVWTIRDSLVKIDNKYADLSPEWVEDIQIIKADFLIQNIDSAFVQWKKGAWARHLDFEQFCEYLLPYKAEELQPLDAWRTYLREFHPDHLDELRYCDQLKNSSLQSAITLNDNLWYYMRPEITEASQVRPIYRLSTRLRMPFGICADFTNMAISVFRSQGIPVALDFTPQWAFRSLGHTWNVVLVNNGKNVPFSGATSNPGQPHKPDERMAKVFRITYAVNPDLKRLSEIEAFVPRAFRYPFFKDVTEEYMDCEDVEIEVGDSLDGRYAYLTVFDNTEWKPVDFALIKGSKVVFRKGGMNSVYLPVCYEAGGQMKAIGHPFLHTYDKEVRPFIPDTSRRVTLKLLRKYPVLRHVQGVVMRLDSGEFHASNDARFREYEMLYRVTDCSVTGREVVLPDTLGAFRYWRYYQPKNGSYCNIADIRFYERATGKQCVGKIIGTDGCWEGNPGHTKDKAFDGDLLTFFDAPVSSEAWTGMDFGKPVDIGRFVFTGRGDGNSIDIGDWYELLYWKEGGWHSAGKRKAETVHLLYEDMPRGALYWLRDLSKGKEERIFSYEDGKQVWW